VAIEKKETRKTVPMADLKECLRLAADYRNGKTKRFMKRD
jgi:hypothetical protein